MSVAKLSNLAFGLSHPYEQHLRCPSGASVVLKMRLSVKHLPFQLELLFKKKKKKLIKSEKIFWSKTFGPLPSYSQGGGGVSRRRGSYQVLSGGQMDDDCAGGFTSPSFIDFSQT